MLPDLLAPGLQVIFCGTAASHASAMRGHYYAGPGNRFWSLLSETGLTPRLMRPDEDRLLPLMGLGFTDLAKGVSGMDREIPPQAYAPETLAALVRRFKPKRLAFTSLTAAKIALGRRHPAGHIANPPFPDISVWVLPSPSGAARGSFHPEPWHNLAADVKSVT